MAVKTKGYTYDNTRKLGALIPLESKRNQKSDVNISQTTINRLKIARNEASWTQNDVGMLRAAALCRLSHFLRTLAGELAVQGKELELKETGFNRELTVFDMMTGFSARDAFTKCCGDSSVPKNSAR